MRRRRARAAKGFAAILVVAATVAACSEEPVPTPVIHDINEPWQETPFAVEEGVLARIEAACRESEVVPRGVPVTVMDVRGAGVGVVVLGDPRNVGDCLIVPGDAPGTFTLSVGGGGTGAEINQPIGPLSVANQSIGTAQIGPLDGRSITYAYGQVGVEVGFVELVLPSGRRVTASNWGRGWFAAWWPGDEQTMRWNVYDRNGVLVSPP